MEVAELRLKIKANSRIGHMQRGTDIEEEKEVTEVGRLRKETRHWAYRDRKAEEWKENRKRDKLSVWVKNGCISWR